MRLLLNVLICIMLCSNSYCAEDGRYVIKKGQKAPTSGVLFNAERLKQLRQAHELGKLCADKADKLEQINNMQKLNSEYHKKNYENLKIIHEKHKVKSWWAKTGAFVLGVVITGFISYGTIKYSGRK